MREREREGGGREGGRERARERSREREREREVESGSRDFLQASYYTVVSKMSNLIHQIKFADLQIFKKGICQNIIPSNTSDYTVYAAKTLHLLCVHVIILQLYQ